MGIVKMTPLGWKTFIGSINNTMKTLEKMDMTTLLNGTIKSGLDINCVACSELWLECDNLNDISIYEKDYCELLQSKKIL